MGLVVYFCRIQFGKFHRYKLPSQLWHLMLGHSGNPKAHAAIVFLRLTSFVNRKSRYSSLVCSSLANHFSICGLFSMRGWIPSYPLQIYVVWFFVCWLSVRVFLEMLRKHTSPLAIKGSRNCSVPVPDF